MDVKSVVIIDDDEMIRNSVQLILQSDHYKVYTASNGKDGIDLLSKIKTPCLILLDLMMPVMDGWEFLDLRKKNNILFKIPVIIISAFGNQAKIIDVNGFLIKPIEKNKLLQVVHQFCN